MLMDDAGETISVSLALRGDEGEASELPDMVPINLIIGILKLIVTRS
jgi:hypothetical protein